MVEVVAHESRNIGEIHSVIAIHIAAFKMQDDQRVILNLTIVGLTAWVDRAGIGDSHAQGHRVHSGAVWRDQDAGVRPVAGRTGYRHCLVRIVEISVTVPVDPNTALVG